MQSTLTTIQKDCLMFIPQNPKLPIPWNNLTHIDASERKTAVKGLVDMGLIDNRHALNMRGICHLVVDCNMPFNEVLKIYGNAFLSMAQEIHRIKLTLGSDNELNIFYYYTFKQMIEWDLFDSNHNFKDLDQKQALKVLVEVGLRLVDDPRVSHDKILLLLNMPAQMIKDHQISRDDVRQALTMYRGYM